MHTHTHARAHTRIRIRMHTHTCTRARTHACILHPAGELSLINPYQANLRAAWLFQASMRPPVTKGAWSEDFISKVLVATFEVMEAPAHTCIYRKYAHGICTRMRTRMRVHMRVHVHTHRSPP